MDLKDIYKNIRLTVVGQDEALKRLLLAVSSNLEDGEYNKRNIVLAGPRGTGKSLMCKIIAREMGLPFKQIDLSLSDGELTRAQLDEAFISFASELYEDDLDIEFEIPDDLEGKEDLTMEEILESLPEEQREAIINELQQSEEDTTVLKGIILLEGFDRVLGEGGSNDILTMAKESSQRILSLDTLGPVVDISGVTFVAEGQFKESGNGFNGRKALLDDELFKSRFTTQIRTKELDEKMVREFLIKSDISPLFLYGDINISKEEANKMVGMIMERKVGLHSAPSVVDEVLMPKLVKKYF